MANDELLLELADRVSRGTPVDWDTALRATPATERPAIECLQIIARLVTENVVSAAVGPDETSSVSIDETLPADLERTTPVTPLTWGHLTVLRKLGEGAYGEVFLAQDPTLGRRVALKLLHPQHSVDTRLARSIIEEGRILARLRHPGIVSVFGADTHDARVGIWMEYVEGETLASIVAERGPFSADEAARIGAEVCSALAAVHKAGLIHSDVKAHNVMREKGGRIVLMDFGAGFDASDAAEAQVARGTPTYLAPELFGGSAFSTSSEIYSVGVLLYHLVTGEYPVAASSMRELIDAHRSGRYRLLRDARPDLSPTFVDVVERATAVEAGDRFATVGELARALGGGLSASRAGAGIGDSGAASTRGAGEERVAGAPRRMRWGWALAAAGAVLAGGTALWIGLTGGAESYAVEASMFRTTPGGEERLLPGARIRLGDRLFMEFRATRDLHVYVLNEDERGNSALLFPLPDSDLQNPIPAGTTLRLPGLKDGKEMRWIVDTPGGTDHFLVFASPERLEDFEAEVAHLALSLDEPGGPALALGPGAVGALRGVGRVEVEPDVPPPSGDEHRLFEMARRVIDGPEEVTGIWYRQIDLANPVE